MPDASLIAAVEKAALWAWPPERTAGVGGWLLKHGGAGSRRLNSAATLTFDGSCDVDRAIAEVRRWYDERHVPPCFHLTDAAVPADLDRRLDVLGWRYLTPTDVLLRPVDRAEPTPSTPHEIVLETRPTPLVMGALAPVDWTAGQRAARVAIFARIRRPSAFAVTLDHGLPIAGGLCVVDGDHAGIFSMHTQPAYRGRGIASTVLARLARWAADMGAGMLYLQVEQANAAAAKLYRRSGFERVYGYHYRQWGEGKA
ncbi:MAG: GNAT family N-acetyltransferase [Geminicoccaceae bacterium]|nr:GNAT family N-acetyltransferase [Geminicoccaceae bacterium]